MPILVGRQGFIALNAESSWGSAASSFPVNNRVNSIALSRSVERVRKTNLSTSAANFSEGHFDSSAIVGGTVVLPLMYKGTGQLLAAALGQGTTTGAGPTYTHTYEPILSPPSLTIRSYRGSGSDAMEEFQGMKVASMTISCQAGEEMIASFEFIGKDSSARSGTGTPTYGDGKGIFHYEMNTTKKLKWDSNNYNIRSFELTVTNNFERRFNLGSRLTAEPQFSDVRSVELSITADLEDNNLYNGQIADKISDLELVFENPTDSFKIEMNNAYISEYNDDVTGPGVIERTATFVGEADSTNKAIKIIIENDSASAVGN